MIFPAAIGWKADLIMGQGVRIPWQYLGKGTGDTGSYLLVLRLERKRLLKVGRLGEVMFQEGYYIYVGSAMRNLRARIERHRRKRKKLHWHIDYLTRVADGLDSIAIISPQRQECEIAQGISSFMKMGPSGFGSSDCRCLTHLFWIERNPVQMEAFYRIL